jgi:phosphate starvation-inducible PhoH-like protein
MGSDGPGAGRGFAACAGKLPQTRPLVKPRRLDYGELTAYNSPTVGQRYQFPSRRQVKQDASCSHSISVEDIDPLALLGPADVNLTTLAKHYKTAIVVRDGRIMLSGPKAEESELMGLLDRLLARVRRGEPLSPELISAEVDRLRRSREPGAAKGEPEVLAIRTPRKAIFAKTHNQRIYLQAIQRSDIILAVGPAGTGKTYLAVAAALESLVSGHSSRIILTRPAVEAGESLGYLPGTFKEKVDPYLRPLYDALFDMMPMERVQRLIEQEVIEVAPLAFMRGRTLSDAYIILDEAQNTTSTQMDLAAANTSGLIEAVERLTGVTGISIVRLTDADVVRPPLVSRIIRAYENRQPPGTDAS